jgi:hypothetical protein
MAKLVVKGRKYAYPSPDSVSYEEALAIFNTLGVPWLELLRGLSSGRVDERFLMALAIAAKMRADGDFDAVQMLKLKITDIVPEIDEPDPAEGDADARPLPPSAEKKPRASAAKPAT